MRQLWIREQLANIHHAIEAKTNEIKELKKIRRKLASSLAILENL
jgi:hypothetical protein